MSRGATVLDADLIHSFWGKKDKKLYNAINANDKLNDTYSTLKSFSCKVHTAH